VVSAVDRIYTITPGMVTCGAPSLGPIVECVKFVNCCHRVSGGTTSLPPGADPTFVARKSTSCRRLLDESWLFNNALVTKVEMCNGLGSRICGTDWCVSQTFRRMHLVGMRARRRSQDRRVLLDVSKAILVDAGPNGAACR
jgi:hypothetical protein